jgi:hypothetical protein
MTEMEKIEQDLEDFTDDLSDEALDRAEGGLGQRSSGGCFPSWRQPTN